LNTPSNFYGLAIVQTLQLPKYLLISLHKISQLINQPRTLDARDVFPPGFAKSLPRCRYRNVDISLRGWEHGVVTMSDASDTTDRNGKSPAVTVHMASSVEGL
jgi:hypothetical protein